MLRKKSLLFSLVALLIAVCLSLGFFCLMPKNARANAAATSVGEITTDSASGKIADSTNVSTLYGKITSALGGSGSDYESVAKLLDTSAGGKSTYSAADLAKVGEYDVTLGGLQWAPVYLSKAQNGHVILTLWLNDVPTEQVSYGYAFSFYQNSNTGGIYVANMYGTSVIRSYLVGSTFATGINTRSSDNLQTDLWKNFLNDFGQYLTTPSNVEWQLTECAADSLIIRSSTTKYNRPIANEAAKAYTKSYPTDWLGGNFSNKTNYYDWAGDKLWVPSLTETGCSTKQPAATRYYGIWDTTDNQLKSLKSVWLRSGGGNGNGAYYLTDAGLYTAQSPLSPGGHVASTTGGGVRPACHLDLSMLTKPKPENQTATDKYSGTAKQFTLPDYGTAVTYAVKTQPQGVSDGNVTGSTFKATSAGVYTLTATINDGGTWSDGSSQPHEFTITINPADIKVNFLSGDQSNMDKRKEREYIFHEQTEGEISKHNILLEDSLIETVAAQPATVKYMIFRHEETVNGSDCTRDKERNPAANDGNWKEKSALSESDYMVGEPGGYCVWFKIEAPNHNVYINYISVHIFKEQMTIETTGDLGTVEYGSAEHDLAKLRQTLLDNVKITNQHGEPVGNLDLSLLKFSFRKVVEVGDPVEIDMNADHWDVGEYVVYAQLVDPDKGNLISFKWKEDGNGVAKRPKYTIIPKNITANISTDDGKNSHIYGDTPSQAKAALAAGSEFVSPADSSILEGLTFKLEKGGSYINYDRLASAGSNYKLTAENGVYGNYNINFTPLNYEVKKRQIKLTIEDYSDYTYGTDPSDAIAAIEGMRLVSPTLADGSLANNDTLYNDCIRFVSYKLTDGGATVQLTATLAAKDYRLEITFESDNYEVTADPATFKVKKAKYSLEANGISLENGAANYDGDEHGLTVTGSLPAWIKAVYTYTKQGEPSPLPAGTKPVDVGVYTVVVTFEVTDPNYEDITEKFQATLTIGSGYVTSPTVTGTLTYTGAAQQPTLSGYDPSTMSLSGNTSETAAGTYRITVTLTDPNSKFENDANTISLRWEILRKSITVQIEDYTQAHGAPVATVGDLIKCSLLGEDTVEGVFGEDFEFQLFIDGDDSPHYLTAALGAGTYEITAENGNYGNYIVTFESGTYIVEPEEATIAIPAFSSSQAEYTGSPQNFLTKLNNYRSSYMLILEGESYLTQTDVGTYTATIKLREDTGRDLKWSDGSTKNITLTFNITVRVLERPSVTGGTYNGKEIKADVDLSPENEGFVTVKGSAAATDAGEYTIILALKDEYLGNVEWAAAGEEIALDMAESEIEITWTIEKAKLPVSWNTKGDIPQLNVPSAFKNLVDIEYEYVDEDGNVVAEDELEEGKSYSVRAILSSESGKNFDFVDADSKQPLENPAETESVDFDFGVESGGESGGNNNGNQNGGNEGSVNPPLGGDTGLSGSGSGSSSEIADFFKENWWWMVLIFAMIVSLIILFAVLGSIRRRRDKREADEKFERLFKMQMMQNYGGFANYQAPAVDGGTAAIEGQQAPAQLPYNQEMLNVAITAAMTAMQAMKASEKDADGDSAAPDNVDVDGFYDSVDDPDNPTGSGGNG